MPLSCKQKKNNHPSLKSTAISSPTNSPNPDDTTKTNGHKPSPGNYIAPSSTQAPQVTDEEELVAQGIALSQILRYPKY
ncbi:hypothetical protein PSHT_09744 [Puccinia striiformis]|uniref:Uncharacterized protein n=1 Tax=Puccinia striiformis TaxID=27350 RepID=A0A2S4VEN8_9BASI|nr:hypothetical protein PSHT_09744 [Puccinia striiformis]